MHIQNLPKIIVGLVTLLILNASLASNVTVSATSYSESAQKVDELPLSPRLQALRSAQIG